jgi:hypothetical protein
MKKINVLLSLLVLVFAFSITSCKKETTTKSSYPLAVRMTDLPGPYNAVYIDLQGVEITGGNGNVVVLNVHPGIYNLLNFSNGVDTLIANGTLEDANVEQIRLILGPNNTVVVNNVTYPLSTPSADQTGLKLQVHQTLTADILYSILLDFDVYKSIVETGNNTYKLKPVIRTIEAPISGIIKGKITPIGTLAYVTATSATNISYSSNVAATGDFKLLGLPAGTYSVTITPVLPLLPITKTNVIVTTGITTDIGTTIIL